MQKEPFTMAGKKYNLRPATKLRATPFSCDTCKDDEPKDNEDEVMENDNDIYPDLLFKRKKRKKIS